MPPAFSRGSSGLIPEGLYLLSEVQERQGTQPEGNFLGYLLGCGELNAISPKIATGTFSGVGEKLIPWLGPALN